MENEVKQALKQYTGKVIKQRKSKEKCEKIIEKQ